MSEPALGATEGPLLLVAPPGSPLAALARERGYTVDEQPIEALDALPSGGRYAAAIVLAPQALAAAPRDVLRCLEALVAEDGALVLAVARNASAGYRLDLQAVQGVLLQHGFAGVRWWDAAAAAGGWPESAWRRLAHWLRPHGAAPALVTARRVVPRPRPLLSIVMPVYNERASFARALQRVHAKVVPGLDKEIIVVESNSTDGTRELALACADWPGVRLILQERPRGKGYAVREGFAAAQGDVVLIQDADEEYDVEDYDALLAPLLRFERAFVLGSRHIGSWKLRKFNDMPLVAHVFNLGHVLFLTLFNVLYGQRLADPFTMYKVFWRDCLHDLHFECNRFDFDFELVIKLVRKGYRPLEIPVSYRARSFTEGKKVSAFRDPLTWLRALAKYRLAPLEGDGPRF